jgi:aromatic amino acid aminotransferase I
MDSAHAIPSDSHGSTRSSLPIAKDFTHHLNDVARNRNPSSLKELYKYSALPGMIPMAGGVPSPEYFPFETLSADILSPDHVALDSPRVPKKTSPSLMSWLFGSKKTEKISVPKYVHDAKPTDLQLATSLQYQAATGPPALPLFLRKYVETVYKPAYGDWDVLLNVGNTDGWAKIVGMLMEKGDAVLVEEWTYPGAENAFLPLECEMVGIKMDGEGVLPSHMDKVLGEWDEEKRGKKRPHVFYTIPTGQNPTGATMLEKRKKEVYEVCRKYGKYIIRFDVSVLTFRCHHLRGRAILLLVCW